MITNSLVAFVAQVGADSFRRAIGAAKFDVEQELSNKVYVSFHGCTSVHSICICDLHTAAASHPVARRAGILRDAALAGQDGSARWMIALFSSTSDCLLSDLRTKIEVPPAGLEPATRGLGN